MANPTPYIRAYDFTSWQATNPDQPLPGDQVDNELSNIQTAIASTQSALTDIRRSDGALVNGIVTTDSLAADIVLGGISADDLASITLSTEVSAYRLGINDAGALVKEAAQPFANIVSARPSPLGNHSSVLTAFTGDLSHVQLAVSHRITGTSTLSQPTTGYVYTPEAYPHYTYLYNSSGWNQSTSSNVGRTAAAAYRTAVYQAGQGDAVCYNGTAYVTGAKAGATSFLANPAGIIFNGGVQAGQAGVYLNAVELVAEDNGYDVGCNQFVSRMTRTNGTGALGAYWTGFRSQSEGSAAADVAYSVYGPFNRGLDLVKGDFGSNNVAISMKAGQKIAFNMSATGNGWSDSYENTSIYYDSGASTIRMLVNNSSAASFHASAAATINNGVNIGSTATYAVNGVDVVGAQDTGWTAMTGSGNKATSYATSTVTLAQLAGRVMSIQAALMTHGLLGA